MVKNLPASAKGVGLMPGLGRFPGEGNGNPIQYSCLEIPWTEESGGLQSTGSQRVRQTDHTCAYISSMYFVFIDATVFYPQKMLSNSVLITLPRVQDLISEHLVHSLALVLTSSGEQN